MIVHDINIDKLYIINRGYYYSTWVTCNLLIWYLSISIGLHEMIRYILRLYNNNQIYVS